MLVTVDKLLAEQLEPLSNKVFDGLNSAYRKRYSCERKFVRVVEDWKRSLDNNHTVGVSSTDMNKAFDLLSPDLLLSKLQANGLRNNSLALLKSYFYYQEKQGATSYRRHLWRMESSQTQMPPGVINSAQLLWNFYQNDQFYENIRSQLSAYADDHQIYISGEKTENVVSSPGEDGNTTGRWYKSNYHLGFARLCSKKRHIMLSAVLKFLRNYAKIMLLSENYAFVTEIILLKFYTDFKKNKDHQ